MALRMVYEKTMGLVAAQYGKALGAQLSQYGEWRFFGDSLGAWERSKVEVVGGRKINMADVPSSRMVAGEDDALGIYFTSNYLYHSLGGEQMADVRFWRHGERALGWRSLNWL